MTARNRCRHTVGTEQGGFCVWHLQRRGCLYPKKYGFRDHHIMYSNEDLERFYFQYQTEALPSGESVQSFCKRNNVPYNIFSKWYKDTRRKIVEVSVDGRPTEETASPQQPAAPIMKVPPVLRIMVDISMSNGLRLSQKNLSYQELRLLIEKLEVLC